MHARVLVVDGDATFARRLAAALRRARYEAVDGNPARFDDDALVELVSARSVAVVALALDLGAGRSGLLLIRRFADRGAAVVVLAPSADPFVRRAATVAGATTVVGTPMPLERIAAAVGEAVPPVDGDHVALHALTGRERQVLAALVAGRAAKDIAVDLTIALPTVRTQIRSLLRKLGVHNQREAILVAVKAGWLVTE